MAKKVFFYVTKDGVKRRTLDMKLPSGFALSQKQKGIRMIHESYQRNFKGSLPLECSSKSESELGKQLSAFNLKRPEDAKSVEMLFQSSKVFEKGGPYVDLLEKTSKDAKMDERLRNSGKLVAFEFDGGRFALEPKTAFYDWLYINTLSKNSELVKELLEYVENIDEPAFTDIEFNPEKSLNCQAEAVALFVYLVRKEPLRAKTGGFNFYEVSKTLSEM